MFDLPVTGASMNPARSLGPALTAGQWQDFWIYLVGPLVGAAVGAFAYQVVRGSEERRVGKECVRLCRSRWSPYH